MTAHITDPELRRRNDGSVLLPGHAGTTYQASNAAYLGLGTPRWLTLIDGLVFSDRARSKILTLDQGWRYSARQLADAGADPFDPAHDDPAAWLPVALRQARALRRKHGGCHKYAIPVGPERPAAGPGQDRGPAAGVPEAARRAAGLVVGRRRRPA